MARERPMVVVLGGPNGAGKTTLARRLLTGPLRVSEFVDADLLAQSLSSRNPIAAGRLVLRRLDELAANRQSFAFEATLASRSLAPRIRSLIRAGYECHLVFLWVPSAEFSVSRVASRVRRGGHAVPEATVRRRYRSGLLNFFDLYRPLTTTWRMYDNSSQALRVIATGAGNDTLTVEEPGVWRRIEWEVGHEI